MELTVLMYHGIISDASPALKGREEGAGLYDVTRDNFRAQMALASKHKETLLITFDDGEMNNYTNAFPVLKEFGMTALFFVIVDRVGTPGYLGWDQIKAMHKEGMRFGSHGLTHAILTQLNLEDLNKELSLSKKILQEQLGETIENISIPRGFCNDQVIQATYANGFKNIYISHKPPQLKAKGIPRIAVMGNWTLKRFKQALNGKIPLKERIIDPIKTIAKIILKESWYIKLRAMLLRGRA